MARLSQHFTTGEFACRDACGYGAVHPELLVCCERLRSIVGRPLYVVSGIRCPVRNTSVKGRVTRSTHQWGGAVDLKPGYASERQARRAGFKGLGLTGRWVTHADVRETQEVVTWRYS